MPSGRMVLHLGVIDVPYVQALVGKIAKAKKGKANKPVKTVAGTQTTGDVAQWLENKYCVMEGFAQLHSEDISQAISNSVAGAIETVMMGGPASIDAFGSATSEIETLFKFTYLDNEEITQTGADGVPTQAAKDGINPRLKSGKGDPRPSFIATGQYQNSFKAWVE
jgi:hypothetical protein